MNIQSDGLFRKPGRSIIPVSPWRLWGGILFGIAFACVFYYLLFLARECLRLLTVLDEYEVWRLSDEEAWFYNLFMAYLSAILAMACVTGFWVKGSRDRGVKRISMLTDMRVLNLYFLSWFGKIVLVSALLFSHFGGQYVFNFYPDYTFVFVLILIVLFLQCWVTIRRFYRGAGVIWMLKAALMVSVLALGLSHVNPVDFRNVDRIIDARNPNVKYDVQLPEVPWYLKIGHRWHLDVYLVKQADSAVVVINNEIVAWGNVGAGINKAGISNSERNIKETWLHIDRRARVKDVERLKEILLKSGSVRNRYVVVPENREYNVRYYRGLLLPVRFMRRDTISELPGKRIVLRVLDKEKSIVNGKIISNKQVVSGLREEIGEEADCHVVLEIAGEQMFSEYIRGWSMVMQMINQERDKQACDMYGSKFDDLPSERMDRVVKRIPTRVLETWLPE